MADEPRQEPQDPGAETIFNSTIGEDWGEAFEAEDFMAQPQADASSEFFLPEDLTAGLPPAPAPGPSASAPPSAGAAETSAPGGKFPGSLIARCRALSLPLKVAALSAPIVLALALLFLLKKPAPTPVAEKKPDAAPKATAVQHAEAPSPTAEPHPPQHQAEAPPPRPAEEHAALKPENAELRKKWRFPAIIVQAKSDNDQDATILATDLTLVLKVHPEIMPPTEKDAFVREMIFQFYANQPAEDLRRFSLERGEMTRKLQAWIVKQWPGLPLDTVTVDRYQLL